MGGYTKKPNFIIDSGLMAELNGNEYKVLDFLMRMAYGFGSNTCCVSGSLIRKKTGISKEETFSRAVRKLEQLKLKGFLRTAEISLNQMIEQGMIEEAYHVYQNEALRTAYHAIGYKELIPYFEKKMPLQACIDKIKQETRRYAKRQLTWFRKNDRIQWIILDKSDKKPEIMEKCQKIIAKSGEMCYNIN